jgi:beta-glucosidase
VFVGYRWFDAHALQPAFPFGFGLSYTHFSYGALTVTTAGAGVVVSATITNSGSRAGSEAPQLYLRLPSLPGVPEPPAQLKGFHKVALQPGQSVRVSFPIEGRALSYWDTSAGGWRVAPGCYGVMVGSSSRELSLRSVLAVNGASCPGASAQVQGL